MNREHLWATYGPQGGSRQKKNESKHTSLQWRSIILWNSSLCEWIAKTWRQSWARERRWEKERDLTLWLWELLSAECDLNVLIVEAEESAWDKEFPTLWPDEENKRPLNFSCLFMEGKDGRHGHNKGTTRASNLHAERQEDEEDTASSFSLFFSLRERSLAIDKCHIYYSFSRVYFMLLQSFPRPLFFFSASLLYHSHPHWSSAVQETLRLRTDTITTNPEIYAFNTIKACLGSDGFLITSSWVTTAQPVARVTGQSVPPCFRLY